MKSFLIAATAALALAQAATAQSPAYTTASARVGGPGMEYMPIHGPRVGELECLREKATGRRVCRTRYEWRQIAARISRGQHWN